MQSPIAPLIPKRLLNLRRRLNSLKPLAARTCNICGYSGWFEVFGRPPRLDARCPSCLSLERHRLLLLALQRGLIPLEFHNEKKVLHFAPEPILEKYFREKFSVYTTADLYASADLTLDIEHIDLQSESCALVIANHVFEHVDDLSASREICRILTSDGLLVCMVPIVEGWDTTYENPAADTDEMRRLHFGQNDHVRYYGRDFRDRIARGGLRLITEITAGGEDVVNYGLMRGEKVFVFGKTH